MSVTNRCHDRTTTRSGRRWQPVSDLHAEYVERGGRFFVCPVCVKTRGLQDSTWADNAEVAGFPAVFEYTTGGALVFNY